MITTDLELLGRITVNKSLGFLKGRVISESEKQTTKAYELPMADLYDHLQSSIKSRLQHFIEPGHQNILNNEQTVERSMSFQNSLNNDSQNRSHLTSEDSLV